MIWDLNKNYFTFLCTYKGDMGEKFTYYKQALVLLIN